MTTPGDLQWEVAFWRENRVQGIDRNGAVATGQVLGWRPQSPDATRVRAAIEANDRTALDQLYSRESVASVDIRVMTKEDDEWSATMGHLTADTPARLRHEDVGDYVSRMDAWHKLREYVSEVETWYGLATPATRNDLSLTFQCELWRVIGVLADGVMEEPPFVFFPTRGKK